MALLKNPKHERFAQLIAKGKTALSAYLDIHGGSKKSAQSNSSRLMTNDKVKARIAEIQGAAADKVVWSIQERLQFCKDICLTPAGDIKKDHPLCQGYKELEFGDDIKLPDKLRALELFNKMSGDDKVQIEVGTTDTLLEFMLQIRAGTAGKAS